MNNQWSKVGLLGISATTLSFLVMTHSANAASFEFVFQYHNTSIEKGTLSFTDSPLTGIGVETAKLSNLTGASFNYLFFSTLAPNALVYSGGLPPISFTFNNGQLSGMQFETSPVNVNFSTTGGSQGSSIQGTSKLSVSGNQYQEFFTGVESFSNGTYKQSKDAVVSSGNITFTTLEPIPLAPVPEPLTLLGTATAIGFGTLFKKSLARPKKLDES